MSTLVTQYSKSASRRGLRYGRCSLPSPSVDTSEVAAAPSAYKGAMGVSIEEKVEEIRDILDALSSDEKCDVCGGCLQVSAIFLQGSDGEKRTVNMCWDHEEVFRLMYPHLLPDTIDDMFEQERQRDAEWLADMEAIEAAKEAEAAK